LETKGYIFAKEILEEERFETLNNVYRPEYRMAFWATILTAQTLEMDISLGDF